MEEVKMPEPNVSSKPTADIKLKQDESGITQTESFPVIPKNNDVNDFIRPVKMSDLKKIFNQAKAIKTNEFQWDELAISISSLGFGGTLSALSSGVKLDSTLGIIFYILFPIVSFASAVFVIMFKKLRHKTSKYSSIIIEETVNQYLDSEDLEK